MTDILSWVPTLISSVISGVLVMWIKRSMDRRDNAEKERNNALDERAAARKEESLLSLDLQMANAKLSYATAMALKRGHANGEVEDGIKAYEDAKKQYFTFLNKQAKDHLS